MVQVQVRRYGHGGMQQQEVVTETSPTPEQLKKEQEERERLQEEAKNRYLDEQVAVKGIYGTKYFSRRDLQKAYEAVNRKLQGKRISLVDSPGASAAYKFLREQNPEVKSAFRSQVLTVQKQTAQKYGIKPEDVEIRGVRDSQGRVTIKPDATAAVEAKYGKIVKTETAKTESGITETTLYFEQPVKQETVETSSVVDTPTQKEPSAVTKFLTTEPKTLKGVADVVKEKGPIAGGFELAKFVTVAPFQIFGKQLEEGGKVLKEYATKLESKTFKDPFQIKLQKESAIALKVGGVAAGAAGLLTPKTPLSLAATTAGFKLISMAPPIVREGVLITTSVTQTPKAFDTSLTPEERVAYGGIGLLAGTSAAIEVAPFIKGQVAKTGLLGKYKPVKTQELGYKAITKTPVKSKQVGLIPAGKTPKPTQVQIKAGLGKSPLTRGAFGFKKGEYNKFVGSKQTAATSQISFFKKGETIRLDREFFVTPQDPTLKVPITRTSRLGLVEFFKAPKKVQYGLGTGKPQIGLFKDTKISTIISKGAFRIGRQSGLRTGELEATAGIGQTITTTGKIGVTTIKGQLVTLFGARLGGVATKTPTIGGVSTAQISTVPITSAISPAIATSLLISPRTGTPTTPTTPTSPAPTQTTFITLTSTPQSYSTPSSTISSPTFTYFPSSPISSPTSPPTTTIISPRYSPPVPPRTPPKTPPILTFKTKPITKQKGIFSVQVRRRGKFKTIGKGLGYRQAFQLGKERVGKTLGATFRIRGGPTPKGVGTLLGPTLRVKKGKPRTFVEKERFRLSSPFEISEITGARKKKKRRKK